MVWWNRREANGRILTQRRFFKGFLACKDSVTGEVIAKTMTEFITKLGLDMSYCMCDRVRNHIAQLLLLFHLCRGQCYGSSGNVAGGTYRVDL